MTDFDKKLNYNKEKQGERYDRQRTEKRCKRVCGILER